MYKKIILFLLAITMTICVVPFSMTAATTVPVITSPEQYSEVLPYTAVTIRWTAPSVGTVSNYVLAVQRIEFGSSGAGNFLVDREILSPTTTSYTIGASAVDGNSTYLITLNAVMSDGSIEYASDGYFYSALGTIPSGKIISFRIYTGFTDEQKGAIYYSTRTWIDNLGIEKVNTYSFDSGVTSNELKENDGVNTVIPIFHQQKIRL
ncbi:MAG: hypothetical protein IJ043_00475 [Clostridia bacterium]|nr:hypothetical protein [Clostridia bacterium]